MRRRRWFLLLSTAALAVMGLATARPAAGDGEDPGDVPTGTVAFFARPDGTCPPGWAIAVKARGRLVAGVVDGARVGRQVGEPLGDLEDRAHEHAYQAEVVLPGRSISAANGGNGQGAAAQKYSAAGESEAVKSGLPFVQVVACERP